LLGRGWPFLLQLEIALDHGPAISESSSHISHANCTGHFGPVVVLGVGLNVPTRLMIYEHAASGTVRLAYDFPLALMSRH
jgi:hypothetical protein